MLLGIMCMCLAGVHFSVMGGAAKLLGETYSSLQVSWARAFIHMLFLTALFVPRFGLGVLRTKRPGLQLGRAAMLTTSNLCFFYAVTFIPLAKASAISLTTPIIVALLAWPFLRERTTALRVAAMLAGFAGVLIVIRPGGEVFHIASILVVVSASAYAVYQILTRLVAPYDSPETSALWAPLTGAFLVMAALPFVWETPRSWGDAGMFFAIGALGAIGHYLVGYALRFAPANIVSPFQYVQLLSAVAVGWLMFSHMPDAFTWAGGAVIISAGLVLAWAQAKGR
ncbi:MAG: DMT family transporter [Alphaproteobacteria bacterium]|jgi:drug/metabolite transporter (DMT)-like permease|nr:DMT family transporter [Alphaproteobacteria bacterium]